MQSVEEKNASSYWQAMRGWPTVLLLTVIVRLVTFIIIEPWSDTFLPSQFEINQDAAAYHGLALKMVDGEPIGEQGIRRTPGYPAFLALSYSLFGVSPAAAILLQILLAGATAVLVFHIVRDWFGERPALFACLLYAFEPHAVISSCMLLTDAPFLFLLMASIYCFLRGIRSGPLYLLFVAGLLLSCATLVRPISQYMLLVFVLYSIWELHKRLPDLFKTLVVFTAGVVIAISPWLMRNYHEYGHAALSDKGGEHLLRWVAAYTIVAKENKPIREVRQALYQEQIAAGYSEYNDPFDNSKIQAGVAMKHISEDWPYFILVQVKGVINAFVNLDTNRIVSAFGIEAKELRHDWYNTSTSFRSRVEDFLSIKSPTEITIGVVVAAYLLLTYVVALGGFWVALRRQLYSPLVLTFLIIGYFCALIGPIGVARYKLPFLPFYLAFGGLFIHWLLEQYKGSAMKTGNINLIN